MWSYFYSQNLRRKRLLGGKPWGDARRASAAWFCAASGHRAALWADVAPASSLHVSAGWSEAAHYKPLMSHAASPSEWFDLCDLWCELKFRDKRKKKQPQQNKRRTPVLSDAIAHLCQSVTSTFAADRGFLPHDLLRAGGSVLFFSFFFHFFKVGRVWLWLMLFKLRNHSLLGDRGSSVFPTKRRLNSGIRVRVCLWTCQSWFCRLWSSLSVLKKKSHLDSRVSEPVVFY